MINKKELSRELNIPQEFFDLFENTVEEIDLSYYTNDPDRKIYGEVAICYDIDGYVFLKIGELQEILNYAEMSRKAYLQLDFPVGDRMAESINIITIPKNQELVDRLISSTGYLEIYIKTLEKIIEYGGDINWK